MNDAEPLSLGQFTEPADRFLQPKYNNFPVTYFYSKYMFSEKMRETPEFKGLQAENPGLEQRLTEGVTRDFKSNRLGSIQKHEPGLYQAYLIMREYVKADEELFR